MGQIVSKTLGKHSATVTGAAVTPGVAVSDPAALTSAAITGGESPTEAEHNAVRADLVATRTQLIALITSLENAGIIL
jgi:hypothetical protein